VFIFCIICADAEERSGGNEGRDERDGHGQTAQGERKAGPRQVQDAAGDPQGQHETARRSV